MHHPTNFSSPQEYKDYLHCCSKIDVGDTVAVYAASLFTLSSHITDMIITDVMIVAKTTKQPDRMYDTGLILGTIGLKIHNFWPSSGDRVKTTYPNMIIYKKIHLYDSFYKAYANEVRIAKVINKNI